MLIHVNWDLRARHLADNAVEETFDEFPLLQINVSKPNFTLKPFEHILKTRNRSFGFNFAKSACKNEF